MIRWHLARPLTAVLMATALVAVASTAFIPVAGAGSATFVVGYEGEAPPTAALESAGGEILDVSASLHFAVVRADDGDAFERALSGAPGIRYVQPDGLVHASAANWNGANWNGANWNGANWNAANWNTISTYGANWNAANWNGANWNGANWNGANWNGANWNGANWNGAEATMDIGFPYQWGLGAIKADRAWNLTVGSSAVRVCVVDSGVDYTHPDLAPNMWRAADGSYGYNAITGLKDPMDDAGHGTHVAGIVAAKLGNGEGIAGVAQVSIMAVKVLGADGSGTESDVGKGFAWCADNGARIIVASLGTDVDSKPLYDGVRYAQNKGALLIAAAGNGGCNCSQYPAIYSQVVAVGAVRPDLTLADFSATGVGDQYAYVDLVAPGVDIVSTFPGHQYAIGSGTSQAVPFVAGVAALLLTKDPAMRTDAMRDRLLKTAADLGPKGRDPAYGVGIVDAQAALASATSS